MGQPEEGPYQACKLDPGVNRLRLSVPHGVHQLCEEVGNLSAVLQEHVAVLAVGEV